MTYRAGPQKKLLGTGLITVAALFPAFVTVIDLTVAPNIFIAQKIRIVNFDAATRLFINYEAAGIAVHDILDPTVNPGLVLDDEHPKGGVIRLSADGAAVECYVTVAA